MGWSIDVDDDDEEVDDDVVDSFCICRDCFDINPFIKPRLIVGNNLECRVANCDNINIQTIITTFIREAFNKRCQTYSNRLISLSVRNSSILASGIVKSFPRSFT